MHLGNKRVVRFYYLQMIQTYVPLAHRPSYPDTGQYR